MQAGAAISSGNLGKNEVKCQVHNLNWIPDEFCKYSLPGLERMQDGQERKATAPSQQIREKDRAQNMKCSLFLGSEELNVPTLLIYY